MNSTSGAQTTNVPLPDDYYRLGMSLDRYTHRRNYDLSIIPYYKAFGQTFHNTVNEKWQCRPTYVLAHAEGEYNPQEMVDSNNYVPLSIGPTPRYDPWLSYYFKDVALPDRISRVPRYQEVAFRFPNGDANALINRTISEFVDFHLFSVARYKGGPVKGGLLTRYDKRKQSATVLEYQEKPTTSCIPEAFYSVPPTASSVASGHHCALGLSAEEVSAFNTKHGKLNCDQSYRRVHICGVDAEAFFVDVEELGLATHNPDSDPRRSIHPKRERVGKDFCERLRALEKVALGSENNDIFAVHQAASEEHHSSRAIHKCKDKCCVELEIRLARYHGNGGVTHLSEPPAVVADAKCIVFTSAADGTAISSTVKAKVSDVQKRNSKLPTLFSMHMLNCNLQSTNNNYAAYQCGIQIRHQLQSPHSKKPLPSKKFFHACITGNINMLRDFTKYFWPRDLGWCWARHFDACDATRVAVVALHRDVVFKDKHGEEQQLPGEIAHIIASFLTL